jgi:ArsR family transcriptional regulator
VPSAEKNQSQFKSAIFHALADPIRLDILEFLRNGEKCVCEIVPHLSLIQPVVSRHLKILRDVGLVRCRKDGANRYYSVVDLKIFAVIDNITSDLTDSLRNEIIKNITGR